MRPIQKSIPLKNSFVQDMGQSEVINLRFFFFLKNVYDPPPPFLQLDIVCSYY